MSSGSSGERVAKTGQRAVHAVVFAALAVMAVVRAARGPLDAQALVDAAALCFASVLGARLSRRNPQSALLTIPLWLVGWYQSALIALAGTAGLLLVFRASPGEPRTSALRRVPAALRQTAAVISGLASLTGIIFKMVLAGTSTGATRRRLIADLDSPDTAVRHAAITRLNRIVHPETAPALMRFVDAADDTMRALSLDTLSRMDRSITPVLLAAIAEGPPGRRPQLWRVAGALKDPGAIGAAVDAMSGGDREVARAAAAALESIIDPELPAADAEAVRAALAPRAAALLQLASAVPPEVRRTAVIALGLIEHRDAAPVLLRIFQDADENDDIRSEAAAALGRVGAHEAVGPLAAGLEDESLHDGCARAVRFLGRGRDELVARLQSTAVDEWGEPARLRTIRAIGWLGDPAAAPALVALTSDNDARVRAAAAEAIGEVLTRVLHAPALAGRRLPDPIRDEAGWEEVRAGVQPSLARLLTDGEADVRRAAVVAMPWPATTLEPLLDDPDDQVRAAARHNLDRQTAAG